MPTLKKNKKSMIQLPIKLFPVIFLFLNLTTQSQTIPGYCKPETFCFSNSNYSIGKVTFGGINNFSDCINNGYGDYTQSLPPAVVNGASAVFISVAINNGTPSKVAIWIDYNHNNVFDTAEYTFVGDGDVAVGYILIPSTALGGITRMRVRNSVIDNIKPGDACNTIVYGETEDYSVNIIASPIAIIYKPGFSDTLYENNIDFTARIKHIGTGIDGSNSFRPRIWAKKYGSSFWKSFPGEKINGTLTNVIVIVV